jgi:hypothetical protein
MPKVICTISNEFPLLIVKLLLINDFFLPNENFCGEPFYILSNSKNYGALNSVLASCKMRKEKYYKRYMNIKNCNLSQQENKLP